MGIKAKMTLPIETDELHEDEAAAVIRRNRAVLNESIDRSEAEFAEGVVSERTITDIVRDGMSRHRQ